MTRVIAILALGVLSFGCANSPAMFGARPVGLQDQDQEEGIMNPDAATEQAPDEFKVKFTTTQGDIVLAIHREWSPNGADRFYNLVKIGYFEDIAIFRAIEGFMFQFGIHGNPEVSAKWREATIEDDESVEGVSNDVGFITFAKTGQPNSRSVQFFINLGNNERLDDMGFTPFGQIVEGMEIAKKINTEYGENRRADQRRFETEGNAFIEKTYPNVDYIKSASLVTDGE